MITYFIRFIYFFLLDYNFDFSSVRIQFTSFVMILVKRDHFAQKKVVTINYENILFLRYIQESFLGGLPNKRYLDSKIRYECKFNWGITSILIKKTIFNCKLMQFSIS